MDPSEEVIICRVCGKPENWISEYRRHHCYNCKIYPPICPKCNFDLSWISQYNKYYCNNCKKYQDSVEEEKKQPAEAYAAAVTVPAAATKKGIFAKILDLIDRFSTVIQNKVAGGFPKDASPKSLAIYANPVVLSGEVLKYIGIGTFAIILTSTLLFFVAWLEFFGLFIFSFVGPVPYLIWMWKTDRYEREPKVYVFVVFALGFLTTFAAYILNSYIAGPFLGFLSAPIVEETLKGLCVLWIARKAEFNGAMDGIVYGFAAGMGFAAAENFFYIIERLEGNLFLAVLRVFIIAYGHGIYAAMTGRWIGKMKALTGLVKRSYLLPGLIVAIFMHLIYNEVASEILPLIGGGIWDVLCLLIVLAAIKQALSEERLWGYDKGLAPVGSSAR
jgi:RsiW-degrading membrane proteinase PrsW (M82 family)